MNLDSLAQIEKNLQKRQKRYLSNLKRRSKPAQKLIVQSKITASSLRQKSSQILASAGLTGALLLTPASATQSSTPTNVSANNQNLNQALSQELSDLFPHYPTKLDDKTAQNISQIILNKTGIKATPTLEGQSLNHHVGYIGHEQHLKRFPGDNLSLHDEEQVAGIAPGLGAWGYFAPSQDQFTTQDYLREKYYSVAQTLYLPDWNTNFRFLRDWYKYRKILVVNPVNGQSVVTVLADAGPAEWTGKQFGASPEAMKALDLHLGPRKGLVLFFFVDDPDNRIPLGPVNQKLDTNSL